MNPLILVNGQHAYPADTAQDLIPVHANYPDILLEQEAAQALARLMDQLGGWQFMIPVSGWRSLEEQKAIYEQSLGPDTANTRPGLPSTWGCANSQSTLSARNFPMRVSVSNFGSRPLPSALLSATQRARSGSQESPMSRGISDMSAHHTARGWPAWD